MRIANISMFDSVKQTLGKAYNDMANANEVVSTTKRINNLSDDPVGLVTVLDLKSSLANLDQIGRNIDMGSTWLTSGESSLQQISNILSDVKEIAVQMSTATTSAAERVNTVTLIDGYLRQVQSMANTEVGGRYIFSGTETDTIPFDFNADESQVVYSGNDIPFSIKTGRDTSIDIGSNGQDIFGENWDDGNIFKNLMDFKSYLQNNDISGIQSTLDKLDINMDKVNSSISVIGGKTIRLEVKENIIQDLNITYSERRANLEEADITEAIMNLEAKELAYNAALSSASKVMQVSLLDYM